MESGNLFKNALDTDVMPDAWDCEMEMIAPPNLMKTNGLPIPTNSFYTNLLVGGRTKPVWTQPYCLNYCDDKEYRGVGVNYPYDNLKFSGSNHVTIQDMDIKSFIFSSSDFQSKEDGYLSLTNVKSNSVQVQVKKAAQQYIRMPLIQGMGFVTAIYYNLIPKIHSEIGFKSLTPLRVTKANMQKYRVDLMNNESWILYSYTPNKDIMTLSLIDAYNLVGSKPGKGTVFQLFKGDDVESVWIDSCAGSFPVSCEMTSYKLDENFELKFNYNIEGQSVSGANLIYVLPNHSEFVQTPDNMCHLQSNSSVFGKMQGFAANSLSFKYPIINDTILEKHLNSDDKNQLAELTGFESNIFESHDFQIDVEDPKFEMNLNSNIESITKNILKYSLILSSCYIFNIDKSEWQHLLLKLKDTVTKLICNKYEQAGLHLSYDPNWKGIITIDNAHSSNRKYHNHHRDYGNLVLAAAIIAIIDSDLAQNSEWMETVKPGIENLLKDYSNPSSGDIHYPQFRSFDWFHGHSWATGLTESNEGRSYYSTSEDIKSIYSTKLWTIATSNYKLRQVSDLQMSVLIHSIISNNRLLPLNAVLAKMTDARLNCIRNTASTRKDSTLNLQNDIDVTAAPSNLNSPNSTDFNNNYSIEKTETQETHRSRELIEELLSSNIETYQTIHLCNILTSKFT